MLAVHNFAILKQVIHVYTSNTKCIMVDNLEKTIKFMPSNN